MCRLSAATPFPRATLIKPPVKFRRQSRGVLLQATHHPKILRSIPAEHSPIRCQVLCYPSSNSKCGIDLTGRRRFHTARKFSRNFHCREIAREVAFPHGIPTCIAKKFGRTFCKSLSQNSGRGLGRFATRYAPIPCASGSGLASLSASPWPLFCGTAGVVLTCP